MKTNKFTTGMLVRLALMTALSLVLMMLVRIPFPPAPFLVYDPADIPIYITAFAFGPAAGLVVTLVVCLIQAFALGGDGIYGFLMHFVATGAFAVIAAAIYHRNKTRRMAGLSLIVGVVICTAVMCGMNLLVTPIYMGAPRAAVLAMIPTAILPFNLIKAGLNAILTFVLYKRISRFLHNEENIQKRSAA